MASSTKQAVLSHQELNAENERQETEENKSTDIIYNEMKEEEKSANMIDNEKETESKSEANTKYETKLKTKPMASLKKALTLYSTLNEMDDPLSLPYKNNCNSKIWYHFETFLVIHPRMYALFLLYSATWPRILVLLDMYTDIIVAVSLYNNGQSLWFLLSSLFVILPFILVWTVSLRFIQKFINHLYSKEKYNTPIMSSLINLGLTLYIFPPIGSIFVALYEVYLVFYDILNGIKSFIFGTGLVETQTMEICAMKQYRRAVEILAESVPQTLLQLYMFMRNVPVNEQDLYRSLAISGFNLLINAYRFRKAAKMHGISIAEYALSVLQLAEIPIVRLVPRLPAVKKGKLEFLNLAGFKFDKESITPIVEALGDVRCVLNTMKISIGSLINLDFESCKLIGRILKDARIRVFVSRTFSLLHIKNLFEQIDSDNNGYLDENEFFNALTWLNSGLLYTNEQQQRKVFQKLAIRRIKNRDRIYFYDFFKNTASVQNKSFEFDITQIDFPLHYIFQHLITEINNNGNDEANMKLAVNTMEKLFYFCCGLGCFDQIERSTNRHIFFTIVDVLNAMEQNHVTPNSILFKFVLKCFHQILKSDILINSATKLLEMRNTMFFEQDMNNDDDDDDEKKKFKQFVYLMYLDQIPECPGLNIFEYCFATQNELVDNRCYIFVHLFNLYLQTTSYRYSLKKCDLPVIYGLNTGLLEKWKQDNKLPIEYAAQYGLFEVVMFLMYYEELSKKYTADEIFKVCVALLSNQEHHNPDIFELLLKHAEEMKFDIINMKNDNDETMDLIILKTHKNVEIKEMKKIINKSQFNQISDQLLRYLRILSEHGFHFCKHSTLQIATQNKSYAVMNKITEICSKKSYSCITRLLNESNDALQTAIMTAHSKNDLYAVELLLKVQEQDCNEIFAQIRDNLKFNTNRRLWIKFMYHVIVEFTDNHIDIPVLNRMIYELKKQIYDQLDSMELEGRESTVMLETKTEDAELSKNKEKKSVMKKILRLGGMFGQKRNKMKGAAMDGDNQKSTVSFKEMVTALCDKINTNLSRTKPKAPIYSESKTQINEEEYDEDDDDEQETHLYGNEQLESCQKMIESLRSEMNKILLNSNKLILSEVCQDVTVHEYEPKQRNVCSGHFGKIYAMDWSQDNEHIVTASQDGKLLIWSGYSGNKHLAITLNTAWVMTCAFSLTDSNDYTISGGLDNTISVYKTKNFETKDICKELETHEGYISYARFVYDDEIISSSGDGTCILWDIEKGAAKSVFADHAGDVMEVDVNEKNKRLFVSGSTDMTVKVWDMRASERCIANFMGHEADVNTVKWFKDGSAIISGSDDGTVRLFDMRAYQQMNEYFAAENRSIHSPDVAGVTSVDVSKSGQYIFSSFDNGQVSMWSSLKAEKICDTPHDSRVSCIGVSPDGYALATGSWDFNLRIFA